MANQSENKLKHERTMAILTISGGVGLVWVWKGTKNPLTILNPLINARYIQSIFYSGDNVTWELYPIQVGVNLFTPFSVKDGQTDEYQKTAQRWRISTE